MDAALMTAIPWRTSLSFSPINCAASRVFRRNVEALDLPCKVSHEGVANSGRQTCKSRSSQASAKLWNDHNRSINPNIEEVGCNHPRTTVQHHRNHFCDADSSMSVHRADIRMYVRRPWAPRPGCALAVPRIRAKNQRNEAHIDNRVAPGSACRESAKLLLTEKPLPDVKNSRMSKALGHTGSVVEIEGFKCR
jgi:hypothetical protein